MGRADGATPPWRALRAPAAEVCCRVSLAMLIALPAGWVVLRPAEAVGTVPAARTAQDAGSEPPTPDGARARWSRATVGAVTATSVPRTASAPLGVRNARKGAGSAVAAAGGPVDPVEVTAPPGSAAETTVAARPARIGEVRVPIPDLPTRLRIGALGVDAPVVPIGVEPGGAIAVPDDVGVVGWYRHGPAPGDGSGSAMLTAHVDGDGLAGVFFQLAELGPGADLVVDTAGGSSHAYRVVARQAVHKDDLPTETVFDDGGPPVLTLVTCGGPFDPVTRSYRDNVVVTAVPVAAG